jgi:hypothetical protein
MASNHTARRGAECSEQPQCSCTAHADAACGDQAASHRAAPFTEPDRPDICLGKQERSSGSRGGSRWRAHWSRGDRGRSAVLHRERSASQRGAAVRARIYLRGSSCQRSWRAHRCAGRLVFARGAAATIVTPCRLTSRCSRRARTPIMMSGLISATGRRCPHIERPPAAELWR